MPERKTRVAILVKPGIFGAIAIDTGLAATDGSHTHAVGSMDPRCRPAQHLRAFATASAAENAFNEALATSRDRGWTVAHIGNRNNG